MSEPCDQHSFEQLLHSDSLDFGDDSWLTDAMGWDTQYPSAPEEPIQDQHDPAHLAEKQRKVHNPPCIKGHCESDMASAVLPLNHDSRAQHVDDHLSAQTHSLKLPLSMTPLSKPKIFGCNEPGCTMRYARKGDLARHVREEHSDEEYLCPYPRCLWQRKGHGFKRMHRLASHLLKPSNKEYSHPRALSRLDARYIAVDYNDSLVSQRLLGQLSFSSDNKESLGSEIVALDPHNRRCDELAKYADRLIGFHCPQAGCLAFCLQTAESTYYGLHNHLHREHKLDWDQAVAIAKEAAAAHGERGGT